MELKDALEHLSKNDLIELMDKYVATLSIKQKSCQFTESTVCDIDLCKLVVKNPENINKMLDELDNANINDPAIRNNGTHKNELFTKRERQILTLLSDGKSSNEIAQELFISVNTVRNHRASMLLKAKVKNTVQLLRLVNTH